MQTNRRDFLKIMAAVMAPLLIKPLEVFTAPRQPFIGLRTEPLMNLYSHMGVLPPTGLSVCEGRLLEIEDWDGTGYPCLIENACTFGPDRPRYLIYDFDLYNFRHFDHLDLNWASPEVKGWPNMASYHAKKRFGAAFRSVVKQGNGPMKRWMRFDVEVADLKLVNGE